MLNKNKMMQWIEKSIETNTFSIEESSKGEGFLGDVNFVKVIVNDPKKKEKELFLVVKVSKHDQKMRAISSVLCKIEVLVYSEVLPILNKFQEEKSVQKPFNSIPKCYKAFSEEDTEIIVIENLKTRGYEMHYDIQHLNLNHIKLVLKNYAKFHSISFALSDQQNPLFKQIEGTLKNSLGNVIKSFKPFYDKFNGETVNYFIETWQNDVAQKLGKLMEKGAYNNAKKSVDDIPEERVLIHGDCHSKNLMFKYQVGDKENPVAVAFLDFQMSGVHSPMMDLGSFWYHVASTEELSHFKELMEFYYKELSTSVTELGSDINKTFPISKMWKHWEKYSLYGFNQAVSFFHVHYPKEVKVSDMDDTKDKILKMNANNKSVYLERLAAMTNHYFNYKFN